MADNRVRVKFGADTSEFDRGVRRVQKNIKNLGRDLAEFGKATAFLTGPFIAFAPLALKAAQSADDAFKTIRAGTGATGEALEDLKKSFKNLWGTVPEGAGTIATVIADLNTRLGLTGQALEKAGRSALDLSRLLGVDAAKSVQGASAVVQAFHVNVNDADRVMNDLFVTVQSTGIGFNDLTTVLQASAGALQSFGLSAGQSMDFVGQLSKAGVKAEQIKTALVKAQTYLADNKDGIRTFQELLTRVTTAADGFNIARRAFGQEAAGMIQNALKNTGADLSKLGEGLKKSQDELTTSGKTLQTASQRIQAAFQDIQKSLAPAGQTMLDFGLKAVEVLARKFGELPPEVHKAFVAIGGFGAVFAPLTIVVGKSMEGLSSLVGVVGKLGKGLSGHVKVGVDAYRASMEAFRFSTLGASTAVKAAARATSLFDGIVAGVTSALTGPAGIVLAIGAVATALGGVFLSNMKKAREETERLKKIGEETSRMMDVLSRKAIVTELERLKGEYAKAEAEENAKVAEKKKYHDEQAQRAALRPGNSTLGLGELQEAEKKRSARLKECQVKIDATQESLKRLDIRDEINAAKTREEAEALLLKYGDKYTDLVDRRIYEIEHPITLAPGTGADAAGTGTRSTSTVTADPRQEREAAYLWNVEHGNITREAATEYWAGELTGQKDYAAGPLGWGSKTREIYDTWDRSFRAAIEKAFEGPDTAGVIKALAERYKNIPGTERIMQEVEPRIKEKEWRAIDERRRSGFITAEEGTKYYAGQLTAQSDFEAGKTTGIWSQTTSRLFESTLSNLKTRLEEIVEEYTKWLEKENELGQVDESERVKRLDEAKEKIAALTAGMGDIPPVANAAKEAIGQMDEAVKNTAQAVNELSENQRKWMQDLQTGLVNAIVDGQSLADTFKSVGKEMEKWALKRILFGNGEDGGGLLGGLFKGLFGGLAIQAKGGAWDGGVQFFARGGVVNTPTAFAHARGLGIMGEAGPEAILPLRRGPGGQLGVQMIGGGRGSGGVAVSVTVNNSGSGAMSREQAQALGEQLTGVIDARVAQILYEQERRRVY